MCLLSANTLEAQDSAPASSELTRLRRALERADLALPDVPPQTLYRQETTHEYFPDLLSSLKVERGPAIPHEVFLYQQLQQAMPAGASAAGGVDLLSIGRAIGRWKRARDRSAAEHEVRDAIAAYCAAQPDGGTGLALCE
jgi:hypothetical protein